MKNIVVSPAGTRSECGEKIAHRHEILIRLLRHFGIDEETIYQDVEGMKHHISGKTLHAFTLLTEELDRNAPLVTSLKKRLKGRKKRRKFLL